jgi:hypothetical protein
MADEEFGARNGVPGEHLVRLEATKVTTAKDVADKRFPAGR